MSPLQLLLTTDLLPAAGGMLALMLASQPASSMTLAAMHQHAYILCCCTGRHLSFHPSNNFVACCVSSRQAEVLCFDKVLGQVIVRKAAFAAAEWEADECITCHCWTPNGMLLLGTSAGRILKAEGTEVLITPQAS